MTLLAQQLKTHDPLLKLLVHPNQLRILGPIFLVQTAFALLVVNCCLARTRLSVIRARGISSISPYPGISECARIRPSAHYWVLRESARRSTSRPLLSRIRDRLQEHESD